MTSSPDVPMMSPAPTIVAFLPRQLGVCGLRDRNGRHQHDRAERGDSDDRGERPAKRAGGREHGISFPSRAARRGLDCQDSPAGR